jgi:hypothetical protein
MKLGMGGNISFKLVPIVENRFPGFSGEISFCTDEKVGLLDDDFEIYKIVGPDQITISPRLIHGIDRGVPRKPRPPGGVPACRQAGRGTI